jgi:sterol desaturase/sphingolipid hydroxylase (fatty acid hydroxylase superfamily)
LIRVLKRHHQTHHNLALMNDYNFNITFPIWDGIMGTAYRQSRREKTEEASMAATTIREAEGYRWKQKHR